ncbi:hypothetical protein N9189_02890 [Pirellulaceae bacterium]|nr:hypothetical protein [Pirellulaceae bacterium]
MSPARLQQINKEVEHSFNCDIGGKQLYRLSKLFVDRIIRGGPTGMLTSRKLVACIHIWSVYHYK